MSKSKKITILFEDGASLKVVDKKKVTKKLIESANLVNSNLKNKDSVVLEGKCIDFKNGWSSNERFYNKESYLEEFDRIAKLAEDGRLFSSADHPNEEDDFIAKTKEICGIINKLWYDEEEDCCYIRLTIIPTLIGGGYDLIVVLENGGILSISSRAIGYLNEDTSEAYLDTLYTYDVVGSGGMGGTTLRVYDAKSGENLTESVKIVPKNKIDNQKLTEMNIAEYNGNEAIIINGAEHNLLEKPHKNNGAWFSKIDIDGTKTEVMYNENKESWEIVEDEDDPLLEMIESIRGKAKTVKNMKVLFEAKRVKTRYKKLVENNSMPEEEKTAEEEKIIDEIELLDKKLTETGSTDSVEKGIAKEIVADKELADKIKKVKDLEDYIKSKGGDIELTDLVVSELVGLGHMFENEEPKSEEEVKELLESIRLKAKKSNNTKALLETVKINRKYRKLVENDSMSEEEKETLQMEIVDELENLDKTELTESTIDKAYETIKKSKVGKTISELLASKDIENSKEFSFIDKNGNKVKIWSDPDGDDIYKDDSPGELELSDLLKLTENSMEDTIHINKPTHDIDKFKKFEELIDYLEKNFKNGVDFFIVANGDIKIKKENINKGLEKMIKLTENSNTLDKFLKKYGEDGEKIKKALRSEMDARDYDNENIEQMSSDEVLKYIKNAWNIDPDFYEFLFESVKLTENMKTIKVKSVKRLVESVSKNISKRGKAIRLFESEEIAKLDKTLEDVEINDTVEITETDENHVEIVGVNEEPTTYSVISETEVDEFGDQTLMVENEETGDILVVETEELTENANDTEILNLREKLSRMANAWRNALADGDNDKADKIRKDADGAKAELKKLGGLTDKTEKLFETDDESIKLTETVGDKIRIPKDKTLSDGTVVGSGEYTLSKYDGTNRILDKDGKSIKLSLDQFKELMDNKKLTENDFSSKLPTGVVKWADMEVREGKKAGIIDRISNTFAKSLQIISDKGEIVKGMDQDYVDLKDWVFDTYGKKVMIENECDMLTESKSAKDLAKDHDFTTDIEFFDYIEESLINGQRKQMNDLFKMMDKDSRKAFFDYAEENNFKSIKEISKSALTESKKVKSVKKLIESVSRSKSRRANAIKLFENEEMANLDDSIEEVETDEEVTMVETDENSIEIHGITDDQDNIDYTVISENEEMIMVENGETGEVYIVETEAEDSDTLLTESPEDIGSAIKLLAPIISTNGRHMSGLIEWFGVKGDGIKKLKNDYDKLVKDGLLSGGVPFNYEITQKGADFYRKNVNTLLTEQAEKIAMMESELERVSKFCETASKHIRLLEQESNNSLRNKTLRILKENADVVAVANASQKILDENPELEMLKEDSESLIKFGNLDKSNQKEILEAVGMLNDTEIVEVINEYGSKI